MRQDYKLLSEGAVNTALARRYIRHLIDKARSYR